MTQWYALLKWLISAPKVDQVFTGTTSVQGNTTAMSVSTTFYRGEVYQVMGKVGHRGRFWRMLSGMSSFVY